MTKVKWFLTASETLLNQNRTAGGGEQLLKAGEKIHTMGYNEIMVQVGGETQTRLTFWEFLEVKNISENANVSHATCWWWRHPKANHLGCINPCKWWDFNYQPQLVFCRISEPSTLWLFLILVDPWHDFLGMVRYENQQSKSVLWIHLWHRKNTQVPSLKVTSNAPENRLFAPKRKRVLLFQQLSRLRF